MTLLLKGSHDRARTPCVCVLPRPSTEIHQAREKNVEDIFHETQIREFHAAKKFEFHSCVPGKRNPASVAHSAARVQPHSEPRRRAPSVKKFREQGTISTSIAHEIGHCQARFDWSPAPWFRSRAVHCRARDCARDPAPLLAKERTRFQPIASQALPLILFQAKKNRRSRETKQHAGQSL